jgi:hypothetical protein
VARLAEPPDGVVPSFARRPAYADLRMSSALVGYGQIRHNYVLLAGQGYDAYGCEIPDGYVEPALGTYDALIDYTRRARKLTKYSKSLGAYFDRALGVLRAARSS